MWILGKKLERCTILEFKTHLNFSIGKNVHLIVEVIWQQRMMITIYLKVLSRHPWRQKNHRSLHSGQPIA
jgi:hypothetical protein